MICERVHQKSELLEEDKIRGLLGREDGESGGGGESPSLKETLRYILGCISPFFLLFFNACPELGSREISTVKSVSFQKNISFPCEPCPLALQSPVIHGAIFPS